MKTKITLLIILVLAAIGVSLSLKQKTQVADCNDGVALPEILSHNWTFENYTDTASKKPSTRVILGTVSRNSTCGEENVKDQFDLGTYPGTCQEIKGNWLPGDTDESGSLNIGKKTSVACMNGDVGKEIRVYSRDVELFFKIGDIRNSKPKPLRGNFVDLRPRTSLSL